MEGELWRRSNFVFFEESGENDGLASLTSPPMDSTTPLLRTPRSRSYSRNSFPPATASSRQNLSRRLSFYPSRLDSDDGASLILKRQRGTLSYLSRRNRNYDDLEDESLFQEGNGLRVWYDDYTTIDWIHDYVKERVRIRRLRSIGGWRGWSLTRLDSLQAWILISIIGVSAGVIASLVAFSQLWLTDVKTGYCSSNFFYRKKYCCPNAPTNATIPCPQWRPWEEEHPISEYWGMSMSQEVFMIGSAAFALLAALITTLSATASKSSHSSHRQIVYHAAGSGVPQVKTILGGFVIRGCLGLRTLVVKSIALAFAVASGLCIGQQGPLVHIACCVGNVSSRLFEKYATNEAKRREMLSAASAAGVSVAFGAPIGGVLFSLEEVSYYFPSKTMWRSFLCALLAAVTLKLINPFGAGKLVMFQVTYDHDWQRFELIPFLLIGLIGGAYGGLFVKASVRWSNFRQQIGLDRNPIIEVVLVSLLTAYLSYGSYLTRIGNNELIGNLFSECNSDDDLQGLCKTTSFGEMMRLITWILFLKTFLTVVTFGIRIPSGIFSPSMVVGACGGRIIGMLVDELQKQHPDHWMFSQCPKDRDCIIPGVYAMVGAAATLSGVTRMTVSLAVIMVELTGALAYVIPIMCSIMVAKWTADFIESKSIYDSLIRRNGHPYLDHKHEYHPKTGSTRHPADAGDVAERPTMTEMDEYLECFSIEKRYTSLEIEAKMTRLSHSRWHEDGGFAVLYGQMLIGYLAYNELSHAWNQIRKAQDMNCRFYFSRPDGDLPDDVEDSPVQELDLSPWMDQAPLSVRSHTSMELVTELFVKLGVKTLCIIEDDGTFVGLIHKKRLLAWLLNEDLS
ncbi:chloride channel [Zopfochytrium polystomum]|nr:chloride channel [Zopfochytrium polystomum]